MQLFRVLRDPCRMIQMIEDMIEGGGNMMPRKWDRERTYYFLTPISSMAMLQLFVADI